MHTDNEGYPLTEAHSLASPRPPPPLRYARASQASRTCPGPRSLRLASPRPAADTGFLALELVGIWRLSMLPTRPLPAAERGCSRTPPVRRREKARWRRMVAGCGTARGPAVPQSVRCAARGPARAARRDDALRAPREGPRAPRADAGRAPREGPQAPHRRSASAAGGAGAAGCEGRCRHRERARACRKPPKNK